MLGHCCRGSLGCSAQRFGKSSRSRLIMWISAWCIAQRKAERKALVFEQRRCFLEERRATSFGHRSSIFLSGWSAHMKKGRRTDGMWSWLGMFFHFSSRCHHQLCSVPLWSSSQRPAIAEAHQLLDQFTGSDSNFSRLPVCLHATGLDACKN